MSGSWGRFVAPGDRNGGGAPTWPRDATATNQHLTLGVVPSTGNQLRRAQRATWDQVRA